MSGQAEGNARPVPGLRFLPVCPLPMRGHPRGTLKEFPFSSLSFLSAEDFAPESFSWFLLT